MSGKPAVRLCNELLVETLLTAARFVACDQYDRVALGVESEGNAPFAIGGREAHLLHVGMFGAVERVHVRSTKLRAVLAKEFGDGQEFGLDGALKSGKLCLEGIMQLNVPSYIASRLCKVKGGWATACCPNPGLGRSPTLEPRGVSMGRWRLMPRPSSVSWQAWRGRICPISPCRRVSRPCNSSDRSASS